jgi:hypothetical protein
MGHQDGETEGECGPERHDSLSLEARACAEKDQKLRFLISLRKLKTLGKEILCRAANASAKSFFFA